MGKLFNINIEDDKKLQDIYDQFLFKLGVVLAGSRLLTDMYQYDIMLKDKGFFLVLHNSQGEMFNFKIDNANWIDNFKNNVQLRVLEKGIIKSQSLQLGDDVKPEDILYAGLQFMDNAKRFELINPRYIEEKNKQLRDDLFRLNKCKFTTRMFCDSNDCEKLFGISAYIVNRFIQKGFLKQDIDNNGDNLFQEIGSVYNMIEFALCNDPEVIDYICSDVDNNFFDEERCYVYESEFNEFYNKYLEDKDSIIYMY